MEILIVCTHEQIIATIARLINDKDDWRATAALNISSAQACIEEKHFDLVLIGSGISDGEEQVLAHQLKLLKNNAPIIKHYGGGSGLLYAEVFEAMKPNQYDQ